MFPVARHRPPARRLALNEELRWRDWVDGQPDAWDFDAVLRENEVIVERCDTLVDGNGNEHRAGEFAGWGFYWKHGAIHIGQCSEQIAR